MDTTVDPQICCGANVYTLQYFETAGFTGEPVCCGDQVIDESTHFCCAGQVLDHTSYGGVDSSDCCGGQPFNTNGGQFSCCGNTIMDTTSTTAFCCGGEVRQSSDYGGFRDCCDGQPYNPEETLCCGSNRFPRVFSNTENTVCCGETVINAQTQSC